MVKVVTVPFFDKHTYHAVGSSSITSHDINYVPIYGSIAPKSGTSNHEVREIMLHRPKIHDLIG